MSTTPKDNTPVVIEGNQGKLILDDGLSFNDKISIATDVADSLSNIINEQNMFSEISSNKHVNIEGWRTLGFNLGLHAELEGEVEPINLGYDTFERKISNNGKTKTIKLIAFKATTVIKNIKGDILGRQSAICTNEEQTKQKNETFAIYSMAETRSESRAWRQVLDWVMKLAGFETTPVEEMDYKRSSVNGVSTPKAPEPLKSPTTPKSPKPPKEPTNTQEAEFTKKESKKEEPQIKDVTPPKSELEIAQEQIISKNKIGNEAIKRLIQKKEVIKKENLVNEVQNMLGEQLINTDESAEARKIIMKA